MASNACKYRIDFWRTFVGSFNCANFTFPKEKNNTELDNDDRKLIICTVIGLAVYGFSRMKVVPAALVREGINQTRIPFATINKVLLIVTFGGAIIILATELMNRKK